MIINGQGVKPDPKLVEGIQKFPLPDSLTKLRSFLGLAQQFAHFIPDLSKASHDMLALLKKKAEFVWTEAQEQSFDMVKGLLTSPLCVQCFNPTQETALITDASRLHGLGFVLVQRKPGSTNTRVIQCGSRSLSDCETRYATVELEMLGIVFAIEKCDFYLRGLKHFSIHTDHKPLVGLMRKELHNIPNDRLVRMRERLIPYNFTTTWVEGKLNVIADALSRSPVNKADQDAHERRHGHYHVSISLSISSLPRRWPERQRVLLYHMSHLTRAKPQSGPRGPPSFQALLGEIEPPWGTHSKACYLQLQQNSCATRLPTRHTMHDTRRTPVSWTHATHAKNYDLLNPLNPLQNKLYH